MMIKSRLKSALAAMATGVVLSLPVQGAGLNGDNVSDFIEELVRDEGFSRPALEKMF